MKRRFLKRLDNKLNQFSNPFNNEYGSDRGNRYRGTMEDRFRWGQNRYANRAFLWKQTNCDKNRRIKEEFQGEKWSVEKSNLKKDQRFL